MGIGMNSKNNYVWAMTAQAYHELVDFNSCDLVKSYIDIGNNINENPDVSENYVYMSKLSNEIALCTIHGVMIPRASAIQRYFGFSGILDIRDELESFKKMNHSKIIFEIDSPGGTVLAGDVLCETIEGLEVDTIAYSETNMLSLGYWVGCATDKIVTTPSASVGSIGILASTVKYPSDYVYTFKKGKLKNSGSSDEKMTLEEMQFLTDLVERDYDDFVNYVSGRRNWEVSEIQALESSYSRAKHTPRYVDDIVNNINDLI